MVKGHSFMTFAFITLIHSSKYFAQDCLSKQSFGLNSAQSSSNFNFLTFVYYQSISPIFKENVKQVSWVKLPNLMVLCKQYFDSKRSKINSRKLSPFLIGSFLTELTFLNQMSNFSKNLNHHWKCREQKENFQTVDEK